MTFDPFAFIELWVVLAFAAAWAILEWLGRRLDRQRDKRDREAAGETRQTSTTHPGQESHDSHDVRPPTG